MSDARTEILARIGAALGEPTAPTPRPPRRAPRPGSAERFARRVREYGAGVTAVGSAEVAAAAGAIVARRRPGPGPIVVPVDLPAAWRPDGVELVEDVPPLAPAELDSCAGVITGAALAVAETGTVVLAAGAGEGRRALSLVPDLHVCVVAVATIVHDIDDAVVSLAGSARPVTLISGPSATSDIELDRVEGVHGPRRFEVVLVSDH
jgi:L-lactate dehydrogenase complex protein LldG